MMHALKYNCNKRRTKQAKINPTKVLKIPWLKNVL